MSGILAIVEDAGGSRDMAALRMLERLSTRGRDRADRWSDADAVLGVCRHTWELAAGYAGAAAVLEDERLALAADASLYYTDELVRALEHGGVRARGSSPGHLILAAYRAWGESCVERLEGDFAFVLWDAAERRLLCARDFAGKRPLFYARAGNTLIVASTIAAVRAHPACPDELNLAAIAEAASGLSEAAGETCYRAVNRLPAGHRLVHHEGATRRVRYWTPPPIRTMPGPAFDDAADELRSLICRAVAERLPAARTSGVWLSGGRDSTAVFAVADGILRERDEGGDLLAVSISYPPGDPGREDELIRAVARHTRRPVRWLAIERIPLLQRPEEQAEHRDEPFAHVFEFWIRALAGGARGRGASICLDGTGGDQLFQSSPVYLADLLRTGHWPALARAWRSSGLRGGRAFLRWAVRPNLSALPFPAVGFLGATPPNYIEPSLPPWLRRDFVRAHGLLERRHARAPARAGRAHAEHELYQQLVHPYAERIFSTTFELALDEGVELRSPLYDARVIEFALGRPREERVLGRETKRLLRRSMQDLLPPEVVAPRPVKTGLTTRHFERGFRGAAALLRSTLRHTLLDQLGMVHASGLRRSCEEYLRTGSGALGVQLWYALHTELWLRSRVSGTATSSGARSWDSPPGIEQP